MGCPYSFDLRERVATAVAEGESCRAVAARFSVGVATVVRWSRRARETGTPGALPVGGHRPFKLAGEADWLRARLAAVPDLTLRALVAELAERKVVVCVHAVWHFLDHAGLSCKKSLHAAEQQRPDVARQRERWQRIRPGLTHSAWSSSTKPGPGPT